MEIRQKPRLSVRPSSPPIPIPNVRVTVDSSFVDETEDDEVFVSQKRPSSSHLEAPFKRTKMLFPSLTQTQVHEFCVNSPGRENLQKRSLDSLASAADVKFLGKGGFGSVILGKWKGKRVAVKLIGRDSESTSSSKSSKSQSESLSNELNAMDLKHENVVQIYGIYPDPHNNSVIIMEYVGKNNLQTLLDTHSDMIDKDFIHRCFLDVASALSFIHSRGIIHLDVKPKNVLVTSQGKSKLGDFGSSKRLDEGVPEQLVGTSGYQAPEVLQCKAPTPAADVYSFGVLVWQVVNGGELPFKGLHPHSVIFLVVSQGKRPDEARSVSSVYKDLYQRCWHQMPQSRPKMKSIVMELNTTLSIQPRRRSSSLRI